MTTTIDPDRETLTQVVQNTAIGAWGHAHVGVRFEQRIDGWSVTASSDAGKRQQAMGPTRSLAAAKLCVEIAIWAEHEREALKAIARKGDAA